ncbi:hypothetical protein LL06_13425 [Hoeflea sp. BAL378]|uniref:hypothetical protein n=1 Tax=Hoeflea sp. BAL378 TaxID=1547437 RepID=UPI0005132480|nr:hypothetical protein [Hoeflea sp. BAL378]KGF69027.1 hypothetical protein LL06_13425 [Hoeflea sp. BAL378]
MNKFAIAAALSLATILPFVTASASAATVDTKAALCTKNPDKAAKAGIDCTATSTILRDDAKAATKYPSGPVNFGNGIVF